MEFEEAIKLVKQGKKVTRTGWNGKDQYIFLIKTSKLNEIFNLGQGQVVYDNAFAIKTAQDHVQIGWLASQGDMQAVDWKEYKSYENYSKGFTNASGQGQWDK